jgi:hypothetical protein
VSDDPGGNVSYEDQRRRYEQFNADRGVVEQAAAHLGHQAIRAAYAGLEHKHLAFGLALILDEIARLFRDLDEQLRTGSSTAADRCSVTPGQASSGRPADEPAGRHTVRLVRPAPDPARPAAGARPGRCGDTGSATGRTSP